MVHLEKMHFETSLFFETVEEIYARVFRAVKPTLPVPGISVQFRKYANANSKVRLADGQLLVRISDLLQNAPAPVQESLARILLAKLFRGAPDSGAYLLYRRYLERADVRQQMTRAKQQRGRKSLRAPRGQHFDLQEIFVKLNAQYFNGVVAEPHLGWSQKWSRTILGHYDPVHHTIVLSRLLDSAGTPPILVEYILFHEILHIVHPTEQKGGRRCIHTSSFKRAEKDFSHYLEARKELKSLSHL